jgi:hypothetical protein
MTDYELGDWASIPGIEKEFSPLHHIQTGSRTSNRYRWLFFPRLKRFLYSGNIQDAVKYISTSSVRLNVAFLRLKYNCTFKIILTQPWTTKFSISRNVYNLSYMTLCV